MSSKSSFYLALTFLLAIASCKRASAPDCCDDETCEASKKCQDGNVGSDAAPDSDGGLPSAGMSRIVLPSVDYDFGEMTEAHIAEIWSSAGLSRRFGHGDSVKTMDFEGKRSIQIRNRPFPEYQAAERTTWGARFSSGMTSAKVLYRAYVPNDFDFGPQESSSSTVGQTAKHGLGLSSEFVASGGQGGPTGFSTRLNWRRNVSNGPYQYNLYLYHFSQESQSGDDLETGVDVIVGRWVDLAIDVQMNSSYESNDGVLRVWIDGNLKIDRQDIRFIGEQPVGGPAVPEVNTAVFSSFFGGGTGPEWTPNTTQYVNYADLFVAEGRFYD